MVNTKYYFLGLKSLIGVRSPALPLACSFLALGALLREAGFNFEQSVFSSFLTYALPGQLVMAESYLIGSTLINIFLAVWLVNARLYPMTVSMFPLLNHPEQPKWKYYLSCHFLAVSSWLLMKENYQSIEEKYRIDFWMGIGTGTWGTAILFTAVGYFLDQYLSVDMLIGLSIVNPVYFFCMMIGAMSNLGIKLAVILGCLSGPIFYLINPEWSILFGGVLGGSLAFYFGGKYGT